MAKKLRIVLAQLNLHVGDIAGNLQKHIAAANKAKTELKADIIVFPELSLTGYPPEDLLFRPAFIEEAQTALETLIAEVKDIHCLVGYPYQEGHALYNTCSLFFNGKILGHYHKQQLPNYGVFDESRYFTPGNQPCIVTINDIPLSLVICEDLWTTGPTRQAANAGARLILAPNASPFESNKHEQRVAVLTKRTQQEHIPIIYVNHVCGQDELVFDGGSMVMNGEGKLCQLAKFFTEELLAIDVEMDESNINITSHPIHVPSTEERIYGALMLGLRDYVEKNHFPGVILGLSGGIDSALTLAIAIDALGKDKVKAVYMPSRYSSDISLEEASTIAQNVGIPLEVISIEPVYKSFLESLAPQFRDKKMDVTEENIQARCRAILLMALSNKFGHLVLTTGNRSELAVGYCTLYGDMAGGFSVLKDIPKTLVYELANYRNQIKAIIPTRTIERAPSAELAPNQKDQDSLPPYSVLDQILFAYLNESKSIEDIIALGWEREVVIKIVNLIRKNEYKRKQATIGPHINHKSFGKDWRYPLTNGFKG